jgi:hypothetical protein
LLSCAWNGVAAKGALHDGAGGFVFISANDRVHEIDIGVLVAQS